MSDQRYHGGSVWREDFTANEADLLWLTRYEQRVRNHDANELHSCVEDVTEDGVAVHGIDGGLYTTYMHDHPFDDMHVAIIDYPGWADYIDFPRADVPDRARGDGLIAAWIQDRTDPSHRPLQSAPSHQMARSEQEETVLAHLLAHPGDIAEMRWLPADTFTADLRHLYIITMRSLHDAGQAVTADSVAVGVEAALAQLSTWHRRAVEDASEPYAYLRRIALTDVEPLAAFANAEHLLAADTQLSLASKATTYFDRTYDMRLQPRPMREAVDVNRNSVVAATTPDRQQLWAAPQTTDDAIQQAVQPPF